MSSAIELSDLTIVEKISVMENLWEDLCKNANDSLSPAWHEDLLAQREEALAAGDSGFTDWNTAKKKILESL